MSTPDDAAIWRAAKILSLAMPFEGVCQPIEFWMEPAQALRDAVTRKLAEAR